jgi:hypothetical protein
MDAEQLEQSVEAENSAGPTLSRAPNQRIAHLAIGAGGLVLVILMFAALFLPWVSSGGVSQSLAEYASPRPAIIAWVLLALGVSIGVIAAVTLLSGERRALYGLGVGAVLYIVGAVIWYGSAVWPTVIASGCQTNGGPLCANPALSPTTADTHAAAGFVLGIVSSLLLLGLAVIGAHIMRRSVAPRSPQ